MTKLVLDFFHFTVKNKLFQSVRVRTATPNKNSQKEQVLEVQSPNTAVSTWTSLHFIFQKSFVL